MPTNYDEIAEQYKRSKQVPWRYYIEQNSLCELLGDITGASVLDLACGDGHYTRVFKRMGAARVAGVDLSDRMIDLAFDEEIRETLDIEYNVADARDVPFKELFDVVTAAYLLNYARSEADLSVMAETIHNCLKPGGRFVAVNNNPTQDPGSFEITRKYGFVKRAVGKIRNGTPIHFCFFQDDGEFVVENYHLEADAHIKAFESVGFRDVQWRMPELAGTETGDRSEYWNDFLRDPPVALFSCAKRESTTRESAHSRTAGI